MPYLPGNDISWSVVPLSYSLSPQRPQMTPMEILQAYGRGRGISAVQSQAAAVPAVSGQAAPVTNGNHTAAVPQNGHSNSQEDEEAFENSEDEVKKEIRRIRKKLKMVERLEARCDAGEKLSAEEQEKVDAKQMFEYQLQTLTLDWTLCYLSCLAAGQHLDSSVTLQLRGLVL